MLDWSEYCVRPFSGEFYRAIGLSIASRLMGLLLAAIAVEFFALGIVKLLPGLAGP